MATPEKSIRQLMEQMGEVPSPETEFLMEPDVDVDVPEGDEFFVDDPDVDVMAMEDGSAIVDFGGGGGTSLAEVEHGANLAEHLSEQELAKIANDVDADFRLDEASRREWEEQRVRGMESLGLKYEEKTLPWPGACAVVHPLLTEAIVRFQAQTIGDIMPAAGPVRSTIVGLDTEAKRKQAQRVERYMNFTILNRMPEYRPETEKLLFGLALDGSAFRKLYPKASEGNRPCSVYIPAADLVVNYDASDLRSAERVSHRMRMSDNEVRKMQVDGHYRDIALTSANREYNSIREKIDQLTGSQAVDVKDTRRIIIEQHGYFDIGENANGIALPYVVVLDQTNREVLSIRRNWDEEDDTQTKKQHFVHYEFVPGLGFYGLGLAHLVGPSASAATSILQQLVDSGTIANLPGGLKTRGLRLTNSDDPILPGEFRDVDVPIGTLSENIMFLPHKEPSAVLYQLLGGIVEDGRRFASMADLKISDMNQEAPVGTTLAIIERAMKMQSAIEQRIYSGLRDEFKILARLIRDFTDPAYPYEEEGGPEIKGEDFDDRIDVIPVADPNASSMAQKIMQYQAALTAAQQAPPGVFDMAYLNRQFVEIIGMRDADKVVPMKEEIPAADPVSENANIMNGSPVASQEWQDHEAHLRVHLSLQQSPEFQQMMQNSPAGQTMASMLDAHIREHTAHQYRREIERELGVPLPPLGQPIPADVEKRLSVLAADAAEQLTGKKQAMAQAEQNAAMQQDPVIQQKEKEIQLRQQELQRKAQKDQMDDAYRNRKMALDRELEMLRLAMQKEEGDLDRQQQREKEIIEELSQLANMAREDILEGTRLGIEAAKALDQGMNRNGGGNG